MSNGSSSSPRIPTTSTSARGVGGPVDATPASRSRTASAPTEKPAASTTPIPARRWPRSARPSRRSRRRSSASPTSPSSGIPTVGSNSRIDLRRDISRVIRRVRPQRVVGQSPERNFQRIYASHPDHLAAGEATHRRGLSRRPQPVRAPRAARSRGASRGPCDEIYLMTAIGSDAFVDITDTVRPQARRAALPRKPAPRSRRARRLIRDWTTGNAAGGGLPDGVLAEAFLRVDTPLTALHLRGHHAWVGARNDAGAGNLSRSR